MNATYPLAVLELDAGRLTLRSRWFAGLFGLKGLDAVPAQVRSAFPCRGIDAVGVGFRTMDGLLFVFWTEMHRDSVLDALRDHGFTVKPEARCLRDEMTRVGGHW